MAFKRQFGVVFAFGIALAGCSTTTPSAEITRFHLGQPIPSDTIMVVPSTGAMTPGTSVPLEFSTYANMVATELDRVGFHPVSSGPHAYRAVLGIEQTTRAGVPKPPALQIGLGGGTSSGGAGLGGGISFPIGKPRNTDVRVNMLSIRIARESDGSAVWEGRAVQEIPAGATGATLTAAVPELARALLTGFPGPSGQTVRVKLKP